MAGYGIGPTTSAIGVPSRRSGATTRSPSGGHEIDGAQVVDGQAMFAHHPANPAPQGQTADTHRGRITRRERQAVLLRLPSHLAPGQPRLDACDLAHWVDTDGLHRG